MMNQCHNRKVLIVNTVKSTSLIIPVGRLLPIKPIINILHNTTLYFPRHYWRHPDDSLLPQALLAASSTSYYSLFVTSPGITGGILMLFAGGLAMFGATSAAAGAGPAANTVVRRRQWESLAPKSPLVTCLIENFCSNCSENFSAKKCTSQLITTRAVEDVNRCDFIIFYLIMIININVGWGSGSYSRLSKS
jgi:hypothetical protein